MPLFLALLLLALSAAAETQLRGSQVPSSLRKAISKKFSGSEIVDAYKDREDGKTIYEVVIEHQGDHYIVVGDSREIIEVDLAEEDDGEEVPVSELPRNVRIAAERSITNAEIVEAYRMEDNNGTFYEVIVETRRGDYLLVLNSGGRLLERQELKDQEGDDEEDDAADDDAWDKAERGKELQLARAPSTFRRNALAAVKGKLETVYELKRNGEKYYEFHVKSKEGMHRVILDRKGKLAHTAALTEKE
jgi:uncharacterized membrane protein YkoI